MIPAPSPLYNVASLRRSVNSLTVELLAVYEELALLYSVGPQIGRLADENQIAAVAMREAIQILSADCGWVALWDGDRLRVHETCRMGIEVTTIEHINHVVLEPLFHDRQNLVSHAFNQEYKLGEPDAPARFLTSALSLEGNWRGYLCLGRHESGSMFLSPDQKLISALALLTTVELENMRLQRSELENQRLVNELELARSIQQSLLPRNFSRTTFFDAGGFSEPCSEIGGDFFDLIPVNPDLYALVIADVSGKGPPAALQAAMVQGMVHATCRTCPELPSLMATLNECLLTRATAERFVTAFAATLSSNGTLFYSNGGHTLPLWIRADGRLVELAEGGPLLGVFPKAVYSQGSIHMTRGDLIVLYTDGVTEAQNRHGELFGTARLLAWARQQRGRLPGEVKDSLIATVRRFCGTARQNDDRSVLVVQYTGPSLN